MIVLLRLKRRVEKSGSKLCSALREIRCCTDFNILRRAKKEIPGGMGFAAWCLDTEGNMCGIWARHGKKGQDSA